MGKTNRKMRRREEIHKLQCRAIDESTEFTLKVVCNVLKNHFGKLQKKETRINNFLDIFNEIASGGEIK